jgi:hypothetical protein
VACYRVTFTFTLMTVVHHSSEISDLTNITSLISDLCICWHHENILCSAPHVLQKRALKLQQTKQKAALHREQQRELQLQRETDLIAKPVSSHSERENSS